VLHYVVLPNSSDGDQSGFLFDLAIIMPRGNTIAQNEAGRRVDAHPPFILFPPLTGSAKVTLAWDPNTEPRLAGHRLYYVVCYCTLRTRTKKNP